MEQPAPCEAGPDVEAESLVGERCEHDEPIINIDVGQPFAHCECGIAPAHGERLTVDDDVVRALPTCRMNSDDPSVRPELAQALHLPDQVLGGHGCRVRSSPSEKIVHWISTRVAPISRAAFSISSNTVPTLAAATVL